MTHLTRFRAAALLALVSAIVAGAADPAPLVSVPRPIHPGAGQVLYFVLTDRFANGNPANDTGGIPGGPDDHGFDPTLKSHYQGGDFAGLIAQLDYIKGLGATALWVTPSFRNKPVQQGTAGYHGYWVLDFLAIDPHLGTNEEFRALVDAAHARGIRVIMDIITNHTADVIQYEGGDFTYRPITANLDRDAAGRPFDPRWQADNGIADRIRFPAFDPARSFALTPVVPEAERAAKNPAWLNDVTLYHNRGNTTFTGENSLFGDFVGLDDLYTENPRVVQGFIEIYQHWIDTAGVDGFRIDTAKHVNREFWQAFGPAIRAHARTQGRDDFISFGEVMTEAKDVELLSAFSTVANLDSVIDFAFLTGARDFVSKGGDAAALARLFAQDDLYTDHDSNVHGNVTCLGNHDLGRFAWFLEQDNPGADDAQLLELDRLGHGLLFLARGQPTVYYGDEQGMIGTGNDQAARESMFASRTPLYRDARLLGTTRTGADDKFDPQHPLYRLIRDLAALRAAHPAFARGAMLVRPTGERDVFAFSRIERAEGVEYLVALNNARTTRTTARVPSSQPAGARWARIFDSKSGAADVLTTDADGAVRVELAPLQFAVWRAAAPLPAPARAPTVTFATLSSATAVRFSSRAVDGQLIPLGQELRVELDGNDGFAEVTFVMERASRPGQYELLGVDDAPPFRVFWRPPPDLNEEVALIATADDLRGHRASARVERIRADTPWLEFGIDGATVPELTGQPEPWRELREGESVPLTVRATGTGPLEYQWFKDGAALAGATEAALAVREPGRYLVAVRNRAGTTVGDETMVARAEPAGAYGRLVRWPGLASRQVAPREIDVWLPPGYDAVAEARFPVIYMHDGQNLFDAGASFGGEPWRVHHAMARLIASGRTAGAILVGIWNRGTGRASEYMPEKPVRGIDLSTSGDAVKHGVRTLQSDAYLRFVVGEVKPFIDRTYRTRPERAQTFVMGSSMGGLISAYALVEYPDVFGAAACLSTHWPAGDGALINYLARRLPPPGAHRIYFDHGTATLDAAYAPYQQRMDVVMRGAGYREGHDWVTRTFPGADHSERSWRERVEIPLAFLLGL